MQNFLWTPSLLSSFFTLRVPKVRTLPPRTYPQLGDPVSHVLFSLHDISPVCGAHLCDLYFLLLVVTM